MKIALQMLHLNVSFLYKLFWYDFQSLLELELGTLKWCECPIIALRGQPTGSPVPMVLNYSHCVVLGSGPA